MSTTIPPTLEPERIPQRKKDAPHWVGFKIEEANGKPTKVPYCAKWPKRKASTDNSKTWATFDEALAALQNPVNGWDGIGFVFHPVVKLKGADLDNCLDPITGELEPWAAEIVDELDSYTEISFSGTGLHIVFEADAAPFDSKKTSVNGLGEDGRGKLELFSHGVYFTVTGHVYGHRSEIQPRQDALDAIYKRMFKCTKVKAGKQTQTQAEDLRRDDAVLIEKIRASEQGALFTTLFDDGDVSGYGDNDESAGDLALCNILAWWCDYDLARADVLYRRSALMRPKWDEKRGATTYGERTLSKAAEGKGPGDGYQPGRAGPRVTFGSPGGQTREATETEPDLLEFLRTDYGNAERLAALHGASIRFCSALGWLIWDGRRWKSDEGPGITRKALETARVLFSQAARQPDSDRRADWVKHSLACEKKAALENAITLAKSIPGISVDIKDFDQDPMLFNVLNGTIDLRTGELRPHRREDLITKLAPVIYDPAATCPQWLEFQRTITKEDQELIDFKQRAYGYSLTGDISEHVLFIAYGNGGNGKGTEAETIREALGEYAQTTPFDTFTIRSSDAIRNDVARLVGSRLVTASEGDAGKRLAESLVKQLTGGDTVAARFLQKEFFEFKPQFKLWLATNHKPVIRGTDEGIWRRIRLVPYTVTIPEEKRDGKLPEKLRGELSGVLNWMLEGCLAWQRTGLRTAEAVQKATKGYREESDVLSGFLSAMCDIDELYSVAAKKLYDAYEKWCSENGEEAFTNTMFGRLLNERGFTPNVIKDENKKSIRIREGLALKDSESQAGTKGERR